MDTAAWLARKLGQPPPQQQPQQYVQQPQYPQQQYPQQQQPQPQQYQQQLPPDAKITAMEAVASWKGGQGVRVENDSCPNCGSADKYFSRAHLRDKRTGVAPAPLCMACGYAGDLFEQQSGNMPLDDKAPVVNDRRSMAIHQETQRLKEEAMRNQR